MYNFSRLVAIMYDFSRLVATLAITFIVGIIVGIVLQRDDIAHKCDTVGQFKAGKIYVCAEKVPTHVTK